MTQGLVAFFFAWGLARAEVVLVAILQVMMLG